MRKEINMSKLLILITAIFCNFEIKSTDVADNAIVAAGTRSRLGALPEVDMDVIPGSDNLIKRHIFDDCYRFTNYLGVQLFGVWTIMDEDQGGKKIIVPIRNSYTKNSRNEFVDPISIWHTRTESCLPQPTQSMQFQHVERIYDPTSKKPNASHTEPTAIQVIQQQISTGSLQKAFQDELINCRVTNGQLVGIGFNFFSTNDVCDDCLKDLKQFKEWVLQWAQLPITITFEAKFGSGVARFI